MRSTLTHFVMSPITAAWDPGARPLIGHTHPVSTLKTRIVQVGSSFKLKVCLVRLIVNVNVSHFFTNY